MTATEFLELYARYCSTEEARVHSTRYALIGHLLRRAWCRETAHPDSQATWSETNPALGQCAVSALVVYDLLGGAITRCTVDGFGSHYANLVNLGEMHLRVDLTLSQFPSGTRMHEGSVVSSDHLLHSSRAILAGTPERYVMLRERVAQVVRNVIDEEHCDG